jgi:acyl-CoA synthetase (AMP-forming)/AMP-acid ligase II
VSSAADILPSAYPPPGELPGRVFAPTGRMMWHARVAATPDRDYLIGPGRRWTFAETDTAMRRVATGLSAIGVGPGIRVGVGLVNSEETMLVHLALRELKAVIVPLVPGLTEPELRFQLRHSGVELLIIGSPLAEVGEGLIDDLPRIRSIVRADRGELDALHDNPPRETVQAGPDEPDDELAPWAILYTSGSTGRPKGVVLPAGAFSSAGSGYADMFELRQGDNYLLATPMAHAVGALTAQAMSIYCGCRLTIVDRFSPSAFWGQVLAHDATVSILFPAHLNLLLETQSGAPAAGTTPLRLVITHMWHDAYLERFGGDLALCWGMTETGAASTGGHPGERPMRPGFVGRAMHDVELAVDGGEIRLRHRHRMLEYLDDPVATAETVTPDGWVRSGDVGELDDEGRLFYGGRIKNMIKRSGENISPEELENALVEHGEVSEVLVVGVPDPIRTEEVAAIVVAAPGTDPQPEQLVAFLADGLARFKLPRYVSVRAEALARLANGKIDRRKIVGDLDLHACWDRQAARSRR